MNWISVKDKKPEYNAEVLVKDVDGYIWNAFLSEYNQNGIWSSIDCCGHCDKDIEATHWMPLPEKPKE